MEATGVFHQAVAAMAHAAGMRVFVLNPRALKHYVERSASSHTDHIDTRMIARYAMHEQAKLFAWEPPPAAAEKLAQLLQRRDRLVHAKQLLAQSLAGVSALKGAREELLASLKRMIKNVELLMVQNLPHARLSRSAPTPEQHRGRGLRGGHAAGGGATPSLHPRRIVHRLHRLDPRLVASPASLVPPSA